MPRRRSGAGRQMAKGKPKIPEDEHTAGAKTKTLLLERGGSFADCAAVTAAIGFDLVHVESESECEEIRNAGCEQHHGMNKAKGNWLRLDRAARRGPATEDTKPNLL